MISHCPICGYPLRADYDSAEELRSEFSICDCCGCEFGYDDNEAHFQRWRDSGCPWSEEKEKPKDWKLEDYLKNTIRPWPPKR